MKGENQKLKLIYLIEILTKYTDEEHLLNATEIIAKLHSYGIDAERKSVYSDIKLLVDNKILDIEQVSGRYGGFHVLNRKFELAELKLLVDAVQASKFITNKQCAELIKKIADFSSVYDENKLSRSVYIYDRASENSRNTFYAIDTIHTAISENKAISFKYSYMKPDGKREMKHDGTEYNVSPYALLWRDENYYLVAFDHHAKCMRHYRVDRTENIRVTDEIRIGREAFEAVSLSNYSSNVFEMFGGDEYIVHFECDSSLAGAMFDRFGSSLRTSPKGDKFEFYAPIQESVRFYGWVFGFEGKLKILSPQHIVDGYLNQIKKVAQSYDLKSFT